MEESENAHRWPEFLPGGEAVLFAALSAGMNWNDAQIAVQSLATGERRNLIQGGTHPRYASSGHLIYEREGNLMAVPFDARRLQVTGAAVQVVDGVVQAPLAGAAQYSISATGALVYVPGSGATQRRLVWVSRNGAEQPLVAPPRGYRLPRISPDGQRLAVSIEDLEETQVWLYDLARGALTRFTFEGNSNFGATWTPDGKRILAGDCFLRLADGSGAAEAINEGGCNGINGSFSPDGQLVAFSDGGVNSGDISVLNLSDRKAQPFLQTPFNEAAPVFSPDGRWLAYFSDESGRGEVYVQPYPGPGAKWPISTDGGSEPVWNRNGRELFYRSGNRMMAVDISTQPGFSAGRPKLLFEGLYLPTPVQSPNYDVSPDGQRFLMVKPITADESAPTQINVVLNWFDELKRVAPAN
jgi:dipeptidyl aminopeptidase/acylaminoacyl peptidase